MRNKTGFTLAELVVVSAAMVVISLAIYATLSSGIKIWQRICMETQEEDVCIFFEKLTSDLRNGIVSNKIKFSGKGDGFELPTLVMSRNLKLKSAGLAKYLYDPDKKVIRRYLADISDMYNGVDGTMRELLCGVGSARFHYYVYDTMGKEYLWQDEPPEYRLLLAIRVELEMERNGEVIMFADTVSVPAGH